MKRKQDSLWNLIEGAHDAWSGWLCVLIVGLFTGAAAGVIDIGASWMTDLKFGICPQAFWLNQEQCCWSSNETSFEAGNCSQVIQTLCGTQIKTFGTILFHVTNNGLFFPVAHVGGSPGPVQDRSWILHHILSILHSVGPFIRGPFRVPSANVRTVRVRVWYPRGE